MKKILVALLSIIFLLPNLALANTESNKFVMEELSIRIMPEYAYHPNEKNKEQPPLLIGYQGSLMNKTGIAQKGLIEIPLPTKSKNFRIGYVADYNRDQSQTYEIQYELDKKNQTISWTTTEEIQPGELYKFVIEFYTDEIKEDNNNKSLSYEFTSFADIGIVNFLFLEPLKSESYRLTPEADSHQENGYGMNMFMYQVKGMKANDQKEIKLEYKRTETKTTMDIMEDMNKKNPQESQVKNKEFLPKSIIFGVLAGLILLFTIILLYFLKKRAKKTNSHQPVEKKEAIKPVDLENKKKHLRGLLLAGSISEQEYRDALRKLGE
jgi:uncharacterized membrane protein